LAIVQVGFVDHLGDHFDATLLQREPLDQRLERTVLAVMPKIRPQDVERDAFAGGVGRVGEGELRVRITETLDEPGGRDPVDVRPRPGHPGTAAGWQRSSVPAARPTGPALRYAQTLRRRLPERPGALTGRSLQIIDRLDPVQLALQSVQLPAQLGDGAAVIGLVPVDLRKELPASLHHRPVLHRAY